MADVRIDVTDPTSAEARALLTELDHYQRSLYPPESVHLLSSEALSRDGVVFLGAFRNERLVACGAYVNHGGEYGELKRMFVRAEVRGLGIGRRILEALEAHAAAAGLSVMRLETGVGQPEAVRLYERAGYTRRGPFGTYVPDPLSILMEKRLDASADRPREVTVLGG
jgi:putative acetyltransferase